MANLVESPNSVGVIQRTTDATVTDSPGVVFTSADKTAEVYTLRATAVRENTANPLVFFIQRTALVTFAAGVPALSAGGTNPSQDIKIGDPAGAGMDATIAATATGVKATVKGIAGTTFTWYVTLTRTSLLSN